MNRFAKSLGGVVLGMVVLSLGVGCKKEAPPHQESTVTSAPTPAALTRQVGDKVDVQWNGTWWKAKILAVQDGKYRVHYTGWASSWDENVVPERVRDQTADAKTGSTAEADDPATAAATPPAATPAAATPSAAKAPATTAAYAVGSKVDVNWKGGWYQAKILSKVDANYRVHYIGWSASWDDTVPPSRIRAFSGSASKGSLPE
ncbi:MAG: hypothetical protein U0270_16450 [Labilithrix sp.]